ncbi:MAG: hypothetical protein ABI560_14310, partial [Myxococcales bacterium]
TQPPAVPAPQPQPVVVPQTLRAHVPLTELSGLAWAPPLDRYLAVIDDSVELGGASPRAPFVLALDRRGRLDEQTVPIDGVNALDDAEALTGAPDGRTYYLMTSHSPNHKGKVRRSRRQLLRLALEGRHLRVTGSLDLLQNSDGVVPKLENLGLPAQTAVDLEGLCFHDGALYVGLKAPLLVSGEAVIMRLEQPEQAFSDGKLGPTTLSVWGRARLGVRAGGGATGEKSVVSQGIADLFFAPDGALYLCANSPKGEPADGGGGLWRVAAPGQGGALDAKLLRRFPGLKPEGVTLAPGAGALTLVFDRNTLDPLWMTWPLATARPHAGAAP